MADHLHSSGHAQKYLDRFCKYQRNLGSRDWDHALMLTGFIFYYMFDHWFFFNVLKMLDHVGM